ncbi:MAG: Gfo/Idh/MocA family protein [Nocardioidaceae bacterium]
MTTAGSMHAVPVLVAGCWGAGTQHHQRDMYLPALTRSPDVEVVGVWDDGQQSGSQVGRAKALGRDFGVPVVDDLSEALDSCRAVVGCPAPDVVSTLLASAAERDLPVLLDKPTLFGTKALGALVRDLPAATVVAGHHWRFHGAVASARLAVRSGQLGLLHAVHAELIVGGPDGANPLGELRNLCIHPLDVVESLLGPLHGRTHAVHAAPSDGAGESWTISMHLEPDVVVSALVGRVRPDVSSAVHRYRLLGSHGQLLLDLAGPAMSVVGRQVDDLPFGPSSVDAMVAQFLAASGRLEPTLSTAAGLSQVVDAVETAATSRTIETFGGS